jgi:hypothetical protein
MIVRDLNGNVHEAILVPDHVDPRYGKMDLVVDGKALGHFDVAGLELIEADDTERADLARAVQFQGGVTTHPPAAEGRRGLGG